MFALNGTLADSQTYQYLESLTKEPFNKAMQEWKKSGGKIIGCLYNQVPDEIVTAAGMMPYRIRAVGSRGDELADARFTQINCSLVRNYYDSAQRGRFDFIDGLIAANSCDHVRKLFENWRDAIGVPYSYFICFPKAQGEPRTQALAKRINEFKQDFERHFGIVISEESLKAAIDLHNKIRSQQAELTSLRQAANPPMTGAEFMNIMIAGSCMPPALYSQKLKDVLDECKHREGITDYKIRVVLYGGEIDTSEFVEAIESQGALVVGDSLGSFGARSFSYQVSTNGDLMYNLANALLMERQPEPRIFDTQEQRWGYVKEIMNKNNADGVIQVHIPLCDLWSYERLMFDVIADRENIPCLALDTEYIFANAGQTKTRVQAFVETITEGGR